MDIKPPPKSRPKAIKKQPVRKNMAEQPIPVTKPPEKGLPSVKKKSRLKWWVVSFLVLILGSLLVGFFAYQQAIAPKDPNNHQKMRVVIKSGENSAKIGDTLQQRGVIRSSLAFQIHTQLTGVKHQLQAGAYAFSPANSVPQISDHLRSGKTDVFNITILPGQSIKEIKKSFKKQGFTQSEIDSAFSKQYKNPLLGGQLMTGNTLEGYIFPETYQMSGSDGLYSLINRSMDELNTRVQEGDLVKKLKKQKLTLPQAITLASIIQKEVANERDERQVAQIFLKRLREDIRLDADSTFVFAAKQQGKTPSVDFDSEYNTRLHKGLPPGPIANFNFSALAALANPATGGYLYFVSGDDGTTHYAKTLKEHEQNIRRYCQANCNLF